MSEEIAAKIEEVVKAALACGASRQEILSLMSSLLNKEGEAK